MRYIVILLTILVCACSKPSKLEREIEQITACKDLKLGVSIYNLTTGEHFDINGNDRFPMQSVYKLPIAIAVLDRVDKGELLLDDTIRITKRDLSPDLYSPIRDKYPNGVDMPLSEIILYTIAQSDNNGCDLLIDMAGGVDRIEKLLCSNSLYNIQVKNYEHEIQADWSVQFENWTTPTAMVELLKQLNNGSILQPRSTDFIWDVMMQSNTGSIKDLLPSNLTVGYKTGNSGVGKDGVIAAQNCVGIMQQGEKKVAFAIFITDSNECRDDNMNIIAQVGELIYTNYINTND